MEQASKKIPPSETQEFQAVVSLPGHQGLGSCQGPFNSPARPSPDADCVRATPRTPALLRSTPGPARSHGELSQKALVPTQVWPPRGSCLTGRGGGHLLKFGACPQTAARLESWLKTSSGSWRRCVCAVCMATATP